MAKDAIALGEPLLEFNATNAGPLHEVCALELGKIFPDLQQAEKRMESIEEGRV